MSTAFRQPTEGRPLAGKLQSVTFSRPSGDLEGLWKEAMGRRLGGAVFAHPHPLHRGTLHSKVVFRAAQALTAAGYATLRLNFRGVGRSQGVHERVLMRRSLEGGFV